MMVDIGKNAKTPLVRAKKEIRMHTIELSEEAVKEWAKTARHVYNVMRDFEREVVVACREIVANQKKEIKEN
jgi:hypothetical protein